MLHYITLMHWPMHWLENRHVNAGQWWSAAALVGVLAALAFDHTYNFLFSS